MKQKAFFYTGKTYQNATYTEKYTRVSRWITIQYTATESARPYFRHGNRRYYLEDFPRVGYPCGYPCEITAQDGEKATLHAQQSNIYYKPYFLELDGGGERVRVYQFEGTETDYT